MTSGFKVSLSYMQFIDQFIGNKRYWSGKIKTSLLLPFPYCNHSGLSTTHGRVRYRNAIKTTWPKLKLKNNNNKKTIEFRQGQSRHLVRGSLWNQSFLFFPLSGCWINAIIRATVIWELAKRPGDSTLNFLSLEAISLTSANLYQNREQLSSYQSGKDIY